MIVFFRKRIQRARRSKARGDDSRAHVAGADRAIILSPHLADDDFAQVPFFSQLATQRAPRSRELQFGNTRHFRVNEIDQRRAPFALAHVEQRGARRIAMPPTFSRR